MYIRWMAAFRGSCHVCDAIMHELANEGREVACEMISKGGRSGIKHPSVGLVLSRKSIFRRFKRDVWSERDRDGRLYADAHPQDFSKGAIECWAKAQYVAIVVRRRLDASLYEELKSIAELSELPILNVTGSPYSQ